MLTSRWETCSCPLSSCKLDKWMVRKVLTQIINPPRNGAPIVLPLFFAELHFKLVTSQLFLFIWNAAVIIEKSLLKSLFRTSEKKVIHRNKSLCSKQKNQTQSSSTSHFLFHRWPGSTIQTPTLMTRGPKRSLLNWPKPTRYETRQEHNLLFFFLPQTAGFCRVFSLFFIFLTPPRSGVEERGEEETVRLLRSGRFWPQSSRRCGAAVLQSQGGKYRPWGALQEDLPGLHWSHGLRKF